MPWAKLNPAGARSRIERSLTTLVAALCACAALSVLYSAFCAFTWGKFTLIDYGRYTNMIWNCGHGRPFTVLVDGNYLQRHLSFTLALLGPFFHVWNHPFLPSLIQWLLTVCGGLILLRTLRCRGASAFSAVSLFLFYVASPFTQASLLCEFHGTTLLLLLVPWLHYNLCFRKPTVWLPLILLLGLREDAGFAAAPLILFFAVRDKWKAGYVWAALAAGYALLATGWIFPAIAGSRLSDVRPIKPVDIRLGFTWPENLARLHALFWLFLPVLPLLRRGWIPLLLIPGAALGQALISPVPAQHALRLHYAAPVFALLSVALAEAMLQRQPTPPERFPRPAVFASWLILVTLAAHAIQGFTLGAWNAPRCYRHTSPDGLAALKAAALIPADGTLICPVALAGFTANRADLISWEHLSPQRQSIDLAFFTLNDLQGSRAAAYLDLLMSRGFGVRHFDGTHVIAQRGYRTDDNSKVLTALAALPPPRRHRHP